MLSKLIFNGIGSHVRTDRLGRITQNSLLYREEQYGSRIKCGMTTNMHPVRNDTSGKGLNML